MCFIVFLQFLKQNAQDTAKFKTKRMADSPKFAAHFGNFVAHPYKKKLLKTRVPGTS